MVEVYNKTNVLVVGKTYLFCGDNLRTTAPRQIKSDTVKYHGDTYMFFESLF
jgi:hypothetical protein